MAAYRIDYSNEALGLENEFDLIFAGSDTEAKAVAQSDERYETIWDIVEIDDDYNEIRSIW